MTRRAPLLVLLALSVAAPSAHGKKPKKKPAPAADAPATPDPAATPASGVDPTRSPAAPAAPTEAQTQATEEFKKGQELQTAGDLDGAIAQYQKAFALYPDPELQFLLGEVHRLKGDR